MSKIINVQNQVKVTVSGNRVSQVCKNLDTYKLKYSLGEAKNIYSLGMSAQEILVTCTKSFNQSMIEDLAYNDILPKFTNESTRAVK